MNNYDYLIWTEIEKHKLIGCSIFDVYRVVRKSKNKAPANFILLDLPDWVTVIPFMETPMKKPAGKIIQKEHMDIIHHGHDETFLMVEQYRHGSGMVTIEFPAGTVDKGESPKNAAIRELLEETGCEADELIKLGEVCPNPAFQNNTNHFYLARNLYKKQEQNLDEHEEIVIRQVAVSEIIDNMGSGCYNNGTMMMALAYFRRWLDKTADKHKGADRLP